MKEKKAQPNYTLADLSTWVVATDEGAALLLQAEALRRKRRYFSRQAHKK